MKAVFLDRDGTIVEEVGYITHPDQIILLPGAAPAIVKLCAQGWNVFVVSNQASVAKGLITEEVLTEINLRMLALLAAEGAQVNGIYCCLHHPEGTVRELAIECGCRKPKPGLLEQAAREHRLDLSASVMVGDTLRDLEAGRAAGVATILVRTGKGEKTLAAGAVADYVARDLLDAAEWVARAGPRG